MSFAGKGYKVPTKSRYLKLKDGDLKFKILSDAIKGYAFWIDKEPRRYKEDAKIPDGLALKAANQAQFGDGSYHFLTFIVYDFNESREDQRVKILELTQGGLKKKLVALAENEDWGDPVGRYDISITKTGSGKETRYELIPLPETKIDKSYLDISHIDLSALYRGEDPFGVKTSISKPTKVESNRDKAVDPDSIPF